jgi:diguanylate cyclase (GGDEF)-like protein
MSLSDVLGVGEAAPGRLAVIADLLAAHPGCAVGIFDPASAVDDPRRLLVDLGIEMNGHPTLTGGALVQFVAPADAWLVSDLGLAAGTHGVARRTIRLRHGGGAELYIFDVSETATWLVVVIVAHAGDTVAATPPPTAIIASPRIAVVHCDGFGIILSAGESTVALLGRPYASLLGEPVINLVHPDDQEAAIVNWVAAKEQRGVALRWRCRVVRADGSPWWVEVTLINDIDTSGAGNVRVELYDISDEVAASAALAAETELLGLLTESLPVGVAKFDATGRIEYANRRLTQLLEPTSPCDLLRRAARGELDDEALATAFTALRDHGTGSLLVVDHLASDGTLRHLEWTISAARNNDGAVTGGVVCIADVTEAGDLRAALEHRASTDDLTGCLNRAGTMSALERALATTAEGEGVGLLFIDLDGFKGINDQRGHAIGDAVLEVVASRLRAGLRDCDLLGRLGGDEFVIIAPRLPTAETALALGDRVSKQLHGIATIGDFSVDIAASIGVAWSAASSASDLLARADAAMYATKQDRSIADDGCIGAGSGSPY